MGGPGAPSLPCALPAPRVDGKELPPKSWREPKPEYGDFQPVSSDPKNPWPACGPRNGLVGPLQGCGKPGKVSSWGRGWVVALALWPCQVSDLEGYPSLGPEACWMYFWFPRRMGRGEGFLRASRLPGLLDPYSRGPDGGHWHGGRRGSEVFCTPYSQASSQGGEKRCPPRTVWRSQ